MDLDIASSEFVVMAGRSGCGKSTLLRIVAGHDDVTSGAIRIDREDVTDAEPVEQAISMVSQSYALYPHMTVAENMTFGLRVTGVPAPEIAVRLREAARLLQLDPDLGRKPAQLSGGQRQRIAISRAIVRNPKVVLFDEPLSNLDAGLRVHLRIALARLHKRPGSTMIHVTHDPVEAMTLADWIVTRRGGRPQHMTPTDAGALRVRPVVMERLGDGGCLHATTPGGTQVVTQVAQRLHDRPGETRLALARAFAFARDGQRLR